MRTPFATLDFPILEWWKSEPGEDFVGSGVSTAHCAMDSSLCISQATSRAKT